MRHRAAVLVFCAALSSAVAAEAANPSMSEDFGQIMGWLSQEMAHGLAFNAGSTFDPPREVKGYRLQPDLSLGAGVMPLDKGKFPQPRTAALKDMGAEKIFPASVLFPNLTMHLRAGMPGRSDVALRLTNMSTPSNYKIAPGVTGNGQSNSIGFAVRKFFLGGDAPMLGVGANFNYVFGKFAYDTKFRIDNIQGFTADTNVHGAIEWNVNSFGLNAVVSQTFGAWTPFAGLGYNYATGSVRARLEVLSDTPLIAPIIGESSRHPEANQGRIILGTQMNHSWINLFANGEIKAIGAHAGESWIVHAGLMLPFRIGGSKLVSREPAAPKPQQMADRGWSNPIVGADEQLVDAPADTPKKKRRKPAPAPYQPAEPEQGSDLIFIQ